jgi:hypothetical protein
MNRPAKADALWKVSIGTLLVRAGGHFQSQDCSVVSAAAKGHDVAGNLSRGKARCA